MVFREQEAQEVCSVCGELTAECCPRCRTPFCEVHQPSSDERCRDCESQYLPVAQKHAKELQTLRGWHKPVGRMVVVASCALAALCILKGAWLPILFIAPAAFQVIYAERLELRQEKQRRQRFLEERTPAGLPTCYCDRCWRKRNRSSPQLGSPK